jgi:acetylornithine deacetylase/succinyl-diaminopimelate desuccinylase-like protein
MTSRDRLDQLFTYLRFASISTDRSHAPEVRACAEFLLGKFRSLGLEADLHETPGHPVVLARTARRGDRPTVLIYGHYDVQPVDSGDPWLSPPFEPEIRDGVIYARGSTDNKGQNFAHLLGVEETLAEEGELPVNLVFLLEGEEEIGSPNLEPFLRAHRPELACDVIAVSDTGMVGPGIPTLTYGLRGIACLEFTVTGPGFDLHSGIYGGGVNNPAMAAAQLIAGLRDALSGRILVSGFYDAVRPIQEWERESWARLPDGDLELLRQTGVPALFGEEGFGSYERRWARPTVEINGMGSGYQGEGSKTVIGKDARVKISCRLVPDQDPETILGMVADHLRVHCPPSVRIEVTPGHTGMPYVMDPFSASGQAARNALRATFGAEPVLIREGGSIPIIRSFKDVLGVDTLLLGLALPDCMAHAPNENFPVANFEAGVRLNRALLRELATVPS